MNGVTVVKAGGGLLEKPEAFLEAFSALEGAKVLVHGGGREATDLAKRLGIEAKMVEGRRITDAPMLEIVTMMYGGLMNKHLVAALQAAGINALGLTGADLGCIISAKRPPANGIDYGYVGDIKKVDARKLKTLLSDGITPVIAPLTFDGTTLLNTNADSVASAVAAALSPCTLIYCFEMPGVLDHEGRVIDKIDAAGFAALKADGTVSGGMIPKLDNAFASLGAGVTHVRITGAYNLEGGTLICR